MTRQLRRLLPWPLIVLTACTGCHPLQPFYFHEDGDLSHYLDQATQIEEPDFYQPLLEDVEFAEAPLTISDPQPREMWDLELEEVVSISLQNSKVIRNLGGVTPFGFADALIGRTGSASTIYDPAIVESDPNTGVEAALSAFDAQLSMLGSQNGNIFNQTDRPSLFQANSIIRRDLGGLRTELAKRAATGTQFFLRNQTDYSRGDNLLGGTQPLNSIWETLFEMEVRQPLLRGRGTFINRIPVMLARINTDVSLATFEASVRNLLFDVENTYWDLHRAYRQLETAKIGRDSAQATWNNVYEQFNAGTKSAQEEAQSREQYFFFRAQLEQALRDLYDVENRLRYLMGIATSDGRLIRPKDEPTAARVHHDWREILSESLARSAELRQQKWVIERRELELAAAKNQLLPQLDVGATYRWYGIGDNLIEANRNGIDFADPNNLFNDPTGSTAFEVLTDGDYQEAALFFSFQMPVGYRQELSGVRNSQLILAREKARLEDMELNQSHLLATAVRNADFNYIAAQTHFNRWKASDAEVESVNTLYRAGKTTLDLVLDAQRRRAAAQIDYYRSLTEYNKSLAEIHFRKGSLLEYNNIMLSEGPWPDKAYWDALGRARERDASYYFDYGWTRPGVISQGPVPTHAGEMSWETPFENYLDSSSETVPTPEPTPAEREQDPGDEPQQPGPITTRPGEPALNPPARADAGRSSRDVAAQPVDAYDWGSLGLDKPGEATGSGLQPATFEEE